jgi:hypothetical protein
MRFSLAFVIPRPEVFYARQRRKKQFWLASVIVAIAIIVAALL